MKVSIFLKSRAADFPWLEIARDSIRKFCKGFHEVVLCLNEGESFDWPEAKIVHVRESFTGYNFQQAVKISADTFCSGDFILYTDSDVLFEREVCPEEFFLDGKPIWIIRPYGEARSDQQVWRGPSSAFIGQDFPFEGMYRHPHVCPVSVLQRMRGFCQFKHGVSMDEYIKKQCRPDNGLALVFSEFNAIAAFAYNHCHDQLSWVDASKETPRPGCTFQSHTHGPDKEKYLLEFKAKFREILGTPSGDGVHATQGDPAGSALMERETHPLTISEAIAFLQSQGIVIPEKKKRGGRKLGSKNKPKSHKDSLLLAIHSYPGANDTVLRHWPQFQKSGATRIVGIGTTDGLCQFPCESVNIGENSYMKTKGQDDHLCRRLLDTVKWCLTQPEERFIIAEYDVLFLRKFPHFKGINAFLTGGPINGSKTHSFYHNPWCFDRESGETLVAAMEAALPDSQTYPDNSPDLFFGLACERSGIEVGCTWKMFTRNSLDEPGSLDLAVEAARGGAHVIHGVKEGFELESILAVLNDKHLELSHVA